MLPMFGKRIVENQNMINREQNRTHRKTRINKKWAKRYGFTITPNTNIFVFGDVLIMHPTVAEKLRAQVNLTQ